jgi:glycosyltransferase involved in cell wall biosynthesis
MTYNSEAHVRDSLVSILSQNTTCRCRLIISDDGSQDNTLNIAREILAHYDGSIDVKVIAHPNTLGLHGNNNWINALEEVDSKYTCQLDADDIWTSTACIQSRFDFLECNPTVDVVSDAYVVIKEDSTELVETVSDTQIVSSYSRHPHYALLGSCMWKSIRSSQIPVDLLKVGYNDDCFHYTQRARTYAFRSTVTLRYLRTGTGIATHLSFLQSLTKKYNWFSSINDVNYRDNTHYPVDLVQYNWHAIEICIENRSETGIKVFSMNLLKDMINSRKINLYWVLKYLLVYFFPRVLLVYKKRNL